MSEYTIRRLVWMPDGDGGSTSDEQLHHRYYIQQLDDGTYKATTYVATAYMAHIVGNGYRNITAAKAACWDDWVKRLQPALVPVRGKNNRKGEA